MVEYTVFFPVLSTLTWDTLIDIFTVSMFDLSLQLCFVYSSRWSSLWTADLPVGVFDLNTLEYFQHSET